jgi:hypothetical protein
MSIERRRSARVPISLQCNAILPDGSIEPCTVTDVAECGARVRFPYPLTLPKYFRLSLLGALRTETVALAWQADKEAGLEFVLSEVECAVLFKRSWRQRRPSRRSDPSRSVRFKERSARR